MQQNNLYKEIQEKLSHLESNSDWNKDAVWNRINRKEEVKVIKKTNQWVYYGMAASVALISIFGILIFKDNKSQITDNQRVILKSIEEKARPEIVIEENKIEKKIEKSSFKKSDLNIQENNFDTKTNAELQIEPKIEQKTIQSYEVVETSQIVQNQSVEVQKETVLVQDSEEDHYDRKAVKPALNRVVVLNIPVAEEENDRRTEKKSLIGKIFKKNDHPKPERSDKIWAFVKESFKNESIEEKKDSTVR